MKELDELVHKALGGEPIKPGCEVPPYSTDWAHGGPIIQEENIELRRHDRWVAVIRYIDGIGSDRVLAKGVGYTQLEAAMCCFVKFKSGDDHVNQSR